MENNEKMYQINVSAMEYQKEWNILYTLAQDLQQSHIPFKVDGKTMIFAHGLEIPIDKICLTFKWNDESKIKSFFHHTSALKHPEKGFKFFDTVFANTKIRCMFYESPLNGDDDTFLYKNTDLVQVDDLLVPVQSLQFYYENAEKTSEYYEDESDSAVERLVHMVEPIMLIFMGLVIGMVVVGIYPALYGAMEGIEDE